MLQLRCQRMLLLQLPLMLVLFLRRAIAVAGRRFGTQRRHARLHLPARHGSRAAGSVCVQEAGSRLHSAQAAS